MAKFNFKFELDQVVKTPVGGKGIVNMLGVDDGGKIYYVQTESNSLWVKESLLQPWSQEVSEPITR